MPETEQVKTQKYGPIVAIVNSVSEFDKKYEVRRRGDNTLSCQCMGWRFNRDVPRHCRHTKAAAVGGPLPVGLPASRTPQISAVKVEAQKASADIFGKVGDVPASVKTYATERIEQAIKKFLGTVATAAAAAIVDQTPGVRMITLED